MKHRLDAEHAVERCVGEWQPAGVRLHPAEDRVGPLPQAVAGVELPRVEVDAGEFEAAISRIERGHEAAQATGDVEHREAVVEPGCPDHEIVEPGLRGGEIGGSIVGSISGCTRRPDAEVDRPAGPAGGVRGEHRIEIERHGSGHDFTPSSRWPGGRARAT